MTQVERSACSIKCDDCQSFDTSFNLITSNCIWKIRKKPVSIDVELDNSQATNNGKKQMRMSHVVNCLLIKSETTIGELGIENIELGIENIGELGIENIGELG